MRSSNPQVLQVQEEYFEWIRQGWMGQRLLCSYTVGYKEVKSEAVGPETQVTYSKREQ